jgi:hypothetical protein
MYRITSSAKLLLLLALAVWQLSVLSGGLKRSTRNDRAIRDDRDI